MSSADDRIGYWSNRWKEGQTGFHRTDIHKYMSKHLDKLIPEGKANKIFFPLCGKAVDMKWLADQGFIIVGVDGVAAPLEEFFKEQGLESVVEDVLKSGQNVKVFKAYKINENSAVKLKILNRIFSYPRHKSKDDHIRLYCCDIMNFTSDFEGTVDAVWDRGGIEALERKDVPQYVQVMKSLLSPRGRILVETMEYDASVLPDFKGPPFSMTEEELKGLFEPECTVEPVERGKWNIAGKDICAGYYLIIKNA